MAEPRSATDYDPESGTILLSVAGQVLRAFGISGTGHVAIIGGLVPSLLVPVPPPVIDTHVGTSDLDFHLSLHLMDGETSDYYQGILDALHGLEFEFAVDERDRKWKWRGCVRDVSVIVELLCPARGRGGVPEDPAKGTPAERNLGPKGEITALALQYGHLVPLDTTWIRRRVDLGTGEMDFDFPVAGLGSWLCLKADAIHRRDKTKDAYDVVWLVGALGPDRVGERLASSPIMESDHRNELLAQLDRLVYDQFSDPDAGGCGAYASFLGDVDGVRRRRDAAGAMAALGAALRERGIGLQRDI